MLNISKISDIATPIHYSPSEVKHYLPFHQPSFADNMFSIMMNYIR